MATLKAYNKDFFKTWSSDMAYILGFLYADGNIVLTKRGNHYIAIYTSDRHLLVAMRRCMQSGHKVALRSSSTGSVYRIQIGSKEWFSDLNMIGLFPNKTKRMELPNVPEKFFGDFVRGYFDGDGNVWSGLIHKDRKTPLLTLQLSFTSASHQYLVALRDAIRSRGIIGGGIYVSRIKHFSRLTFAAADALKVYEIMYNAPHKLYLKRKKVVFEQFVKLRE